MILVLTPHSDFVGIKFDKLNFGSKVELIVLIYSRDGDLLHSSTQEIGISNE